MAKTSFAICFPRSGSNFLQNVLRESDVVDAISIYKPRVRDNLSRNFKSHAPTPEYLADEAVRVLGLSGEQFKGAKIIWLYRDPRDAMISFYEYTCNRLNYNVPQSEFVGGYDFFLASPIDKRCERRTETSATSVVESYRRSIHHWSEFCASGRGLAVRYEDLLSNPDEAFRGVFRYLGSDGEVNRGALDSPVAQHSTGERPRARASTWKSVADRYETIISGVNRSMCDELKLLDYSL